jgi:hypothetical protein
MPVQMGGDVEGSGKIIKPFASSYKLLAML